MSKRITLAWTAAIALIVAGIGLGIKAGIDGEAMALAKNATNLVVAETKLRVMSVRQSRDPLFVSGMRAIADRTGAVGSVWDADSRDQISIDLQAALVQAAANPNYQPLQSARFEISSLQDAQVIDETTARVRLTGRLLEKVAGKWHTVTSGEWRFELFRFSKETPWLLHAKNTSQK
jgi:endonuclease/exonuclease/phosphatase (EEP) superfamily protein YafD